MNLAQAPGTEQPPALATPPTSAADRSERLLATAAAVARLVSLLQVVPWLVAPSELAAPMRWVLALAAAQTAFFVVVCLRRGRFDGWLAATDTLTTAAMLWPAGRLAAILADDPSGYIASPMYNYAAVAVVVVGLARWPLALALASGTVLTASSVANALAADPPAPLWNAIPDAIPFVGVTLLSWLVAQVLRTTATRIDRERVAAARRAADLARERGSHRERALSAEIASTLDNVIADRSVPDHVLLAKVQAEVESPRPGPVRPLASDQPGPPARVNAADGGRTMTHGILAWLDRRLAGQERMVLVVGIAARLAGIAELAYVLPLVWAQFEHPELAGLLAAGLVIESLVVVWLWLRQRTIGRMTFALDLPIGVLALLVGAWIAPQAEFLGFTYFAYPYTVVLGLSLGLASRRLIEAVGAALVLASAYAAASVIILHQEPIAAAVVVVSYLSDPIIGWTCATLLRRMSTQLEALRGNAVACARRQAAGRASAGRDRLLTALEELAHEGTDAPLRQRIDEQATLLRAVRDNDHDDGESLSEALAATARVATTNGLPTQLEDVQWHAGGPAVEVRDAMVDATDQVLAALTGRARSALVRVEPSAHGIRVTVESDRSAMEPDAMIVARAEARLADVGGSLSVERTPYLELWVPTGTHSSA
jgi:hypothetical protein